MRVLVVGGDREFANIVMRLAVSAGVDSIQIALAAGLDGVGLGALVRKLEIDVVVAPPESEALQEPLRTLGFGAAGPHAQSVIEAVRFMRFPRHWIFSLPEAPAERQAPDCLPCGVCCFTKNERYVHVSAEDLARMEPGERDRITWRDTDGRSYMRIEGGRCIALAPRDGTFPCGIYERRPQMCRDFARGSVICHTTRWKAGKVTN